MTADAVIADSIETETRDELLTLETRYGRVEVSRSHILSFPTGLLGFAAAKEFALVQLDDPKYRMFRILQCVSDPALSFIVLPLGRDAGLIDAADLDAAGAALRFPPDDLTALLLVTVRPSDGGHQLTVNLRAPVLIDAGRFVGVQYVLPDDRYPVRHAL
ncbi:MAG: flagellar assembly protein FliW [Alphaproteobacteria bacterium]